MEKVKTIIKEQKGFYPPGTNLKKLAKAFVEECVERKKAKNHIKKTTLTMEEYFKMVNKKYD